MKILIGGNPFAAHDLQSEATYIGTVLTFAGIVPEAEFAFVSECPNYVRKRFELDSRSWGDFSEVDLFVVLGGMYLAENLQSVIFLLEGAAKAGVPSVIFDLDWPTGDKLFEKTLVEWREEQGSWPVRLHLRKENPELGRALALQEIFALTKAVFVRNARTFLLLQQFGFEPTGINADPLYLLPTGNLERAKEMASEAFWKTLSFDGRLLVVALRNPPENGEMTEWKRFFAGFLTENPSNCVAFFCPEIEQYREELFGELGYTAAVRCASSYPEPEVLQAFLSFASAVITDRREVLIFAVNSLIPFFALESEDGGVEPMLEEYGVVFCGRVEKPDFEKLEQRLGLLLTSGDALTTELARGRARILKRKLPQMPV